MESKGISIRNEERTRLENETKSMQARLGEVKKEEELKMDIAKPDAIKVKPKQDDL